MNVRTRDFVFEAQASRVVFAAGSWARLPEELKAVGASRALIVCTPQQGALARRTADLLGSASAGVHDGAVMHVPAEAARRAIQFASEAGADCVVAVGGGSTIGLGKAIALESSLPIIAVPTTYAGSEMTPIYGITEHGIKKTGRDVRVLPRSVLYDPELSRDLPLPMTISSGINAMAHAAEGLYARDGNPVMSLMAEEGVRAVAAALRALAADPQDLAARTECLYGAWLCGTVLGHVGMALHHKLCHTLGGTFDLPHAQTHTVVLAHALAYNAPAAPHAMNRIARAIGRTDADAARGVFELVQSLGAPTSLRELGMPQKGLARAVDLALADPYWNPRPLERDALASLMAAAWAGDGPGHPSPVQGEPSTPSSKKANQ
jgi:maleylacetate reductase